MNYSETFITNVKQILKIKGIPIGDIERQCEVSPGYFSRVLKEGKHIGLDSVMVCCQALGMSLDEILNYDFTKGKIMEIEDQIAQLQYEKAQLENSKRKPISYDEFKEIKIDDVRPCMSLRVLNCLKRAGFFKVDDLMKMGADWDYVRNIRNMGRSATTELAAILLFTYNIDICDEKTTEDDKVKLRRLIRTFEQDCPNLLRYDASNFYNIAVKEVPTDSDTVRILKK